VTGASPDKAGLDRYLITDGDLVDFRRRVVEEAAVVMDQTAVAGMTVPTVDGPRTAASTDPVVSDIDEAQYRTDDGPCLDAIRHRQAFVITSTRESPSWREFCQAAMDRGVFSTMSLPLLAAGRVLGALNLYARVEEGFTEDDRRAGLRFAARAAALLADVEAYGEARQLSRRVGDAMTARATVEQAKGILMGARGCGPEEAFTLLRRAATQEHLTTHDMARRLVEGGALPEPDPV
jgi:GAF domain-containing protein